MQEEKKAIGEAISSEAQSVLSRGDGGIKGRNASINAMEASIQGIDKEISKLNRGFNSSINNADKINDLNTQKAGLQSDIQELERRNIQEAQSIAQSRYQNQLDDIKPMSDSEAVFNIADKASSMDSYSYSLASAQFAGTQAIGVANSTGGLTPAGYEGARIAGQDRGKQLLDNTATFSNRESIDTFARDLGLSTEQRSMLYNAKDSVDRNRLLSLMTLGRNVSGVVGDKQFNVAFGGAGTTTSYTGGISSQISRSMGVNVSVGNGFHSTAYEFGGLRGAEGVAIAGGVMDTMTTSISNVASFVTPQGAVVKNVSNITNAFRGGKGGGSSGGVSGGGESY